MNLRLHKEFGVNPTISTCIVCGEDTGELALLGANYDGEAPMKMITSVEPCKTCREKYLTNGVMLVEANVKYNWKHEPSYLPNGKIAIIKEDAYKKMFDVPVPKLHITYVEIGLLNKMGI